MTQRFEPSPYPEMPKIEVIPMDKDTVNLLHRILDQNSEIIKMNLAIIQSLANPVPMLFRDNIEDIRESLKR